jgi:hypothetical protein
MSEEHTNDEAQNEANDDLGDFEEETGITPPGNDESESDEEYAGTTESDEDSEEYDEVSKRVSESADKVTVTWKCKRGNGTRDQDEFKVKAKGESAEEVNQQLTAVQEQVAEMMDVARDIQPDEDDE